MVTFIGLIRTLAVASNPIKCLPYQGRKTISFRNGWKLNLSFPQFRDVRDSYGSLRKFTIKQLDEDIFEGNFGDFEITQNLKVVCAFADLKHLYPQYHITKLEEDLFEVKGGGLELKGQVSMVGVFRELLYGEYDANFKDTTVLDIGGFQGESAVYFWSLGAKKIVVYEPTKEYCQTIKENADLNGFEVEIHQAGIGAENTTATIDVFDPCLKSTEKPKKQTIQIDNIADVISRSNADIAKIDCEGAEICLTTVPNDVLRKIPLYIIELHGIDVCEAVTAKFVNAGFQVAAASKKSPALNIVTFKI